MWIGSTVASTLTVFQGLNSYITDPTFKSYLDMMDVPKSVIIILGIIGLLSFLSLPRNA